MVNKYSTLLVRLMEKGTRRWDRLRDREGEENVKNNFFPDEERSFFHYLVQSWIEYDRQKPGLEFDGEYQQEIKHYKSIWSCLMVANVMLIIVNVIIPVNVDNSNLIWENTIYVQNHQVIHLNSWGWQACKKRLTFLVKLNCYIRQNPLVVLALCQ